MLPASDAFIIADLGNDTVMVETFEPPAASEEATKEPEVLEEEYLAIPPLPEVTPPLTPPEMVEITPIEEVRETPPPKPVEKNPEQPKPTPKSAPRPASKPANTPGGSGTSPVVFNGGGKGRFPSPSYPASARSTKQQGTVRVLVTVEASGIPSSAEVMGSSGFPALDSAARDAIQRRWRWPSGDVRKFIVPVRFVLQ